MHVARFARLTEAIESVTGTDTDTAEWLAADVLRKLAALRLASQNQPVPGDDPGKTRELLVALAREADTASRGDASAMEDTLIMIKRKLREITG